MPEPNASTAAGLTLYLRWTLFNGLLIPAVSALNPFQAPRIDEIRAGRKFWGYLDTEALRTRYVLAAHFVRECRHVVEVGGYRGNVITSFLRGQHEQVLVFSLDEEFEPFEREELNGAPCRVRHIRDFFQSRLETALKAETSPGVVVLGLELHGDLPPLLALLKRSQVVVLEASADYPPGIAVMDEILSAVPARTICRIDLDLSANEPLLQEELKSNMNRPFWRRRMHVIEPTASPNQPAM